jgi:ankyrin repeat protein
VQILLDQRNDLNCGQYENRGHTPLTFAASNGHENVVRLLLERGADVEKKNKSSAGGLFSLKLSDQTPLAWAAGNGHASVVKPLLQAGANPDGGEGDGNLSPLAVAAVRGHDSLGGRTALFHAANWGHADVVQLLLQKGADVIHLDQGG